MSVSFVVVVAAAYLLGSIPFGALLARRQGVDIQAVGSGNIGATNVARNLGKKLGALVLLLDAGKGAAPLLVAQALEIGSPAREAGAFAAIVGHCFPVWLRFQGGKGVATALGVYLALDPVATACVLPIFGALYAWKRVASLGSIVSAVAFPLVQALLDRGTAAIALSGAVALLIVVRHRDNIARLRAGEEQGV